MLALRNREHPNKSVLCAQKLLSSTKSLEKNTKILCLPTKTKLTILKPHRKVQLLRSWDNNNANLFIFTNQSFLEVLHNLSFLSLDHKGIIVLKTMQIILSVQEAGNKVEQETEKLSNFLKS